MQGTRTLVIGTRGSALALRQAGIAAAALRAAAAVKVETRVIETRGDKDLHPIPLDTIGKGWFTEEIEEALISGAIDLAVHSLKDMEVESSAELSIGAYLPREDVRDVLITKRGESLRELPSGAIVGTDSIRRKVQLLALRSDLRVESLRGNVPTRLEKLTSGNYDAIIIAAAGLKRLGLQNSITYSFDPHEVTPAPGQGILALQMRKDNDELSALLGRINDAEASHAALLERDFSRVMGGGCRSPVGAYAFRSGDTCHLIGMRGADEKSILREEIEAPWDKSNELGEVLAKKLLG